MIQRLVVITLLATAAVAQTDAQQSKPKQLLRYKFQPEAVRHFLILEGIKMTARMGEREMTNDAVMTTYATATIKASGDEAAKIEQQITRITAKVTGMMAIDYDSNDPNSDPSRVGVPVEAIGAKIGMKITDQGKASDFTAPKTLLQGGTIEQLSKNVSRDLIALPDEAIEIGGTWKAKHPLPLGPLGQPEADVTNKLVSVSDEFFVLKQEFAFDPSTMKNTAAQIDSVKASAVAKLDRRTGMLAEMRMDTTVKLGGQTATTLKIQRIIKPAPEQTPPTPKKSAPAKDGDK